MGDRRRTVRQPKSKTQHKASNPTPTKPQWIRNVCVYCGSNSGTDVAYVEAARELGGLLAQADVGLVYGGGGLGLMGELARAVIQAGGRVTGIIPTFLSKKERMLREAHEMIVVEDMHKRKQMMFDRSDAFVALPGGIGTLEELVEQLTWAQLGRHAKPVILANIGGFWEPFLGLLGHMRSQGFIRETMDVRLATVDKAEDVLPAIYAHAHPPQPEAEATIAEKF